ncbi:hypothetical protein H0H87_000786, partial [Tephrocybe sp. NHM501043]
MDLGIKFVTASSAKKTSHFSTLKTIKEWMTDILAPYVKSVIKADNLPKNQKSILFLDCYPVHIGKDFCFYVLKEHPNVFLIFVPANCYSRQQIIQQAWEKCIVKEFNLRGECLLARNTKAAYHAYYKADKLFHEEIE